MKTRVLFFMLLFALNLPTKATNWTTSYKNAQKLAAATNKFIVVDFWATWCGPCKKMDAEAWSSSEVSALMTNFIPLKIDIDTERDIAFKYSIRSIPDVFIMDANGEIIYHNIGYMSKAQVINLLKKYSYGTQLLQNDIVEFIKSKNGDNALNIAEAYFDFSIYVNKNVRNDFLKIGEKYLNTAVKLYKKENNNKNNAQKISLMSVPYKYLIKGKFEKALKKLDNDFEEIDIKDDNKLLYTFIKFTAYNKINDKENAKIWYGKLKLLEHHKKALLKSRKI